MVEQNLTELYQWKKQQMLKLMDVSDLTIQLSQAVERRDQVSVNMLLNMRSEPVRQAEELETRAREFLLTLPQEEAIRCNQLLQGEPARTAGEEPLANQVAQNRRLLAKIQEVDERTSLRLGGNASFYRKFRP